MAHQEPAHAKLTHITNTPTKAHHTKTTRKYFSWSSRIWSRLCNLPGFWWARCPVRISGSGGKSEVPAMSPGASPDSDAPVVEFPPGSETRKCNLGNKNKVRTFWPFASISLQAFAMRQVFLWYLGVCLGPVWPSRCQYRQEIQSKIVWVREKNSRWIKLVKLGILLVNHYNQTHAHSSSWEECDPLTLAILEFTKACWKPFVDFWRPLLAVFYAFDTDPTFGTQIRGS